MILLKSIQKQRVINYDSKPVESSNKKHPIFGDFSEGVNPARAIS